MYRRKYQNGLIRTIRKHATLTSHPSRSFSICGQDGTLADEGPGVVNGPVVGGSGGVTTSNGKWVNSQSTTTQTLTPMEAQQYSGQSNLHTDGQYYTLTYTNTSTSYQPGTTTQSGPNYVPKLKPAAL
jgi:hypothetical protein